MGQRLVQLLSPAVLLEQCIIIIVLHQATLLNCIVHEGVVVGLIVLVKEIEQ